VEWLNETGFDANGMSPPNAVFRVSGDAFLADPRLAEEVFGPVTLLVACRDQDQMLHIATSLEGNLTGAIHADDDPGLSDRLLPILEDRVGRIIFNGYPTGVEVCPSQQHGGPFPAASDAASTSVGADAIVRFARFIAYQDAPQELLPEALRDANPLGIYRRLNGRLTLQPV
jgi:NADP-dependent aldehyde dehydrogenase